MVIMIVPELEFDDAGSREAVAWIVGRLSYLAGSAAPGEEPPPKNNKIAKIEAKHRNLTARLNVPSSHPGHGDLNCRDLFSQKILFQKTATSFFPGSPCPSAPFRAGSATPTKPHHPPQRLWYVGGIDSPRHVTYDSFQEDE